MSSAAVIAISIASAEKEFVFEQRPDLSKEVSMRLSSSHLHKTHHNPNVPNVNSIRLWDLQNHLRCSVRVCLYVVCVRLLAEASFTEVAEDRTAVVLGPQEASRVVHGVRSDGFAGAWFGHFGIFEKWQESFVLDSEVDVHGLQVCTA
jgi:hypothetical protein